VSVSRFKKKNLIFVDPEVNVDDTYCRDVLLTEEILPVMCVISGEFFFIFLQNSIPAYRAHETISLREWETSTFISPDLWLPQQS